MSRDTRDWQKDMDIASKLQTWDVDPGGVEDAAAFYTLDEDGIYTTIRADGMLGEDAEMLEESIAALPYWLQQYAQEANEVCFWKGEAQKAQREVHVLTMQNEDLKSLYAAEKERADKAEALAKAFEAASKAAGVGLREAEEREQKLKEAIEYAIPTMWDNSLRVTFKILLKSLYPLDKEEDK